MSQTSDLTSNNDDADEKVKRMGQFIEKLRPELEKVDKWEISHFMETVS